MDVWVVDKWEGERANVDPGEHDALAWLNHDEMAGLTSSRQPSDTRRPVKPSFGCAGSAAIDLASVGHSKHQDERGVILDRINDPVVANARSPAPLFAAGEQFDARRPRVEG